MEILARVNPRHFAAINLFQANNDIRYYLNGVRIEPHPEKGAIIVATNGYMIGVVHDPDGFCKEPIIVGDISKQLISACQSTGVVKGLPPTGLYISSGGAVVDYGEIESGEIDPFGKCVMHASRISLIDGQYPDWRRVIPTARKSAPAPMIAQAQYLAVFEKVVKALGAQKTYSGVRIECAEGDTKIVFRLDGIDLADRFVAIVMQMRDEKAPANIVPDWLMPPAPPTKPRYRWTPEGFKQVTA